jgi:hypothetical protein
MSTADFSLSFTEVNGIYNTLKLSMPYDYSTLRAEFDKEEWTLDNPEWYPNGLRSKCQSPTSSILQDLRNYFCSDEIRRILCETACTSFQGIPGGRWLMDADKLYRATSNHGEFNRDLPGFEQYVHVDYKFLVCTGFIYFTESDDPELSTYFYSDEKGNNPQRCTTDFGDGWFSFNDHNSWHGGGNRSKDQVRYSMLFALTLMRNPDFT